MYQGIKIYGLPETISASTMAVEIGQRQYLRRVKVIFIQKSLPGSFGIQRLIVRVLRGVSLGFYDGFLF